MGLFSTVIHVYKKNQEGVINSFCKELRETYALNKFSKIIVEDSGNEKNIRDIVWSEPGIYYLITQPHGDWITIIELNVNVDEDRFYLYELTNDLSKRLGTYTLSFHLHDDDLLLYNLEKDGHSIDGYNSNYQYFLTEVPDNEEILSQRHESKSFLSLIPPGKSADVLNELLNEGYWSAFDNKDLDNDGIPNGDQYDVDEEDRFVRIGTYLEIYNETEYPLADWYSNLSKLNLSQCYLLKAEKSKGLFSKIFKS